MDTLIGRHLELKELQSAIDSRRSEFVILYGRRRIGKTFLVRCFCQDNYSFHFVGAHKKNNRTQLNNFREQLLRYSKRKRIPELKNWHEAFVQLEQYLEKCTAKRKVLFFDEMPWMDTQKSDFVSELEYFWANWVQNRDDIVFIACGSATTWMKEKLEDNQGGLHNRITHRIYLRPFYLSECKQYLQANGFEWSDYQILQYYMVFGRVPYYMSLLQRNLSLVQNIDNLLFRRGGSLSDEFSELYNALFKRADRYIKIVQLLATKQEGFTKTDIINGTGYSGGGLTKMLNNLERCDSSFRTRTSATRRSRLSTACATSIPSSISVSSAITVRATSNTGNITSPTVRLRHGKDSHSSRPACGIYRNSSKDLGLPE